MVLGKEARSNRGPPSPVPSNYQFLPFKQSYAYPLTLSLLGTLREKPNIRSCRMRVGSSSSSSTSGGMS